MLGALQGYSGTYQPSCGACMSMTEEFRLACACLQVLTLTMSISAGILKQGATPQSLQEEVQHVLELQQDDAAQQDMGNYQPYCMGPSALGVDDAISAVQESIDWMRMRSYSLPGDCAHASCSAMGSAALTTEMLAEHCQQASKTLPICTLLAPKPRNIRHDNKQNLVDHNKDFASVQQQALCRSPAYRSSAFATACGGHTETL